MEMDECNDRWAIPVPLFFTTVCRYYNPSFQVQLSYIIFFFLSNECLLVLNPPFFSSVGERAGI